MPQRRQDASAPAIASVPRRLCRSVVVLGVVCLLQGGIFTYSSGTAGAEEEYSQALLSATQIATQAETEPGELEAYALALVNQARRQAGLAPLAWDPLAARVARTHAQELVQGAYASHFDRQGRSPLLRYAQAGGTAFVMENLAYGTGYPPGPEGLRRFLQDSLHTMLAQTPPQDGHRRNLLDGAHTAVGIGLAQAEGRLALVQEFVNQAVRVEGPALRRGQPGQEVRLAGQAPGGMRVYAVQVSWEGRRRWGREERPPAEAYGLPGPLQTVPVVVGGEGRFGVEVRLVPPPEGGQAGVYYLLLWALDPAGRPVPAATVVVQVDA